MIKYNIRRWSPVVILIAVIFALGHIGFCKHFAATGETLNEGDAAYLTIQLFFLESGFIEGPLNAELQLARFFAPIAAAYAIVQTLASVFSLQIQRVWLTLLGGHVVICGLGQKGLQLVKQFRGVGERVVIIEPDEENHDLRHCRELGAVVLIGRADDPVMLRKAVVRRANLLISVAGDDGVNIECAVHAQKVNLVRTKRSILNTVVYLIDGTAYGIRWAAALVRKILRLRPKRRLRVDRSCLKAVIHVQDFDLRVVLQGSELFAQEGDAFEITFFNTFETVARVMLREPPVLTPAANEQAGLFHVLVIGFGRMGEALLSRVIRDWHIDYSNATDKLRVTVIDRAATDKAASFRMRHPELVQGATIDFLAADVRSSSFVTGELLNGEELNRLTTAYVCLNDDSVSVFAALTVRRWLPSETPVIVRMSEESGLATLLARKGSGGLIQGVRAVGLLETTCSWEAVQGGNREMLAQAIHQGYIQDQMAEGNSADTNPSMLPWHELADDLKDSNRDQADDIATKLEAVKCELRLIVSGPIELMEFSGNEIEKLAEIEHARWVKERTAAGWRYGETKNVDKQTSPYLVGWDDIPNHIQEYDRNAVRRLPVILAKADYEIRRIAAG